MICKRGIALVLIISMMLHLNGESNVQVPKGNQSGSEPNESVSDRLSRRSCQYWPFDLAINPLMLAKDILEAEYQASRPPLLSSHDPSLCLNIFFSLTLEEDIILEDQDSTLEVSNTIGISWIDSRLKMLQQCRKITNLTDDDACSKFETSWAVSQIEAILWTPLLEVLRLQKVIDRDFLFTMKKALVNGCTGKVTFYGKIKYKVKCPLDFSMFPFDKQECPLIFIAPKSRVPFNGSLCMVWQHPPNRLERLATVKDKRMGNWNTEIYVEENWDKEIKNYVKIMFEFKRYTTSFIVQTMIPSILMVLASFGSLWVPSNQIPGRMTLAITTCLTHMSMINGALEKAPRTSYLKAIDIWLITCFAFTFSILVEFCLVISLTQASALKEMVTEVGSRDNHTKPKKVKSQKEFSLDKKNVARSLKIAYMMERWAKIILPFFFSTFFVIFVGYVTSTQVFDNPSNVTKKALNVMKVRM
ncbi:hypothetical protein TCAL_02346 [Tigriopus californicus]|uniref:Neurotransmitter-gated ion-channel ligand-binding domain-containing protein n=1 Tax=Tigriopus californicus TaxID=6832 RepID=A0A553NYP8_TIGCA|nr:gamma-aminobutyric acid receptor subunit gamma-1-like [Tigriopus californicus]TRY70557.1 hypothetical protein TCAL_02346 [Tigriopus californicus]|eukprot:TCALIF_02346-PA protein Name:"Similar to GABRR2 Gamma-aminobutyric acid receptor subunit rho-2 (Bos taurus)" AED:0.10 eAED:0.10 QI:0/-1/0/1/-1/1/1/0/472